MSFYDAIRVGASGAVDYEVERSLRFNDGDSPNLTRTPSSASNRRTFTISAWVKRSSFGAGHTILSQGTSGSDFFGVYFPSEQFSIRSRVGGSDQFEKNSTGLFRDVSAWMHVLVAVDTTQSTAEDRAIGYINGVRVTDYSANTIPAQNTELNMNTTETVYIGSFPHCCHWDGYIAELQFIDGQALTPSSFAETDTLTNEYKPKKYTGTYGTNGFYLNFSDNSGTTATTLGKDLSGNGNNFTPNNFSVSAGEGNDSVEDTPTNNWATLNFLDPISNVTFSEGNLKAVRSNAGNVATSNFVVTSGKWYMEMKYVSGTSNHMISVGFSNPDRSYKRLVRGGDGELTPNTGTVAVTFADPDVLMLALDVDNGKWYIGKNGSYMLSGDPANGTGFVHSGLSSSDGFIFMVVNNTSAGGQTISANFGQQGFSYTPPTGFVAFNSQNLPDPTIKLPNKHFDTLLWTGNETSRSITGLNFQPDWVWIKNRTRFSHALFDTVRGVTKRLRSDDTSIEATEADTVTAFNSDGYTIAASQAVNENSVGHVGWNWNAGETDGKTYTVTVVSDSGNKYRFDGYGTSAVTLDLAEGGTYIFNYPSAHPFRFSTTSDGTHGGGSEYTTGVTVLSSTSVQIVVAASAPQLYYFCTIHSGMGGAINTNTTLGSSNFDGSIQSTVKANTTAGFSIATWTSDGSGSPTSFGHGLGVQPDFVLIKNRSGSGGNWQVWSPTFSNATNNFISFNLDTGTQTAGAAMWGTINSSIVSFRHSANSSNGNTMIGYFFNSVDGYSKFGSYEGNGNTNGPFVFTGFRPAWVMIKTTQQDGDWIIIDNKRDPDNVTKANIEANQAQSENTSYEYHDFCANGFKLRTSSASRNPSGQTMLFYAFAESPFKNSRAR